MRKKIVAMSQKNYNNTIAKEKEFLKKVKAGIKDIDGNEIELLYFPSLGLIHVAIESLAGSIFKVGAQNISPILNGPTTGEYSIETLIDLGGSCVEIGHAERRNKFFESTSLIKNKIDLTFEKGMTPLLCIGESEKLPVFVKSNIFKNDLTELLKGVSPEEVVNLVIAYEPVWAIGQTTSASPEYIFESHQALRDILENMYGEEIANQIRIIYGGSVSVEATAEIISNENVDGVFVGRYGHNPDNFVEIINIVNKN